MAESTLTVNYQLEISDFLALGKKRNRRVSSPSFSRFYYYGVLPVLFVALALAARSFAIALIFTTLFVGSGWLFSYFIEQAWWRTTFTKESLSLLLLPWTATITDEGLRFSSEAVDSIYRWSAVKKVDLGPRYLIIDISPLQQLYIPRSFFRDEEHLRRFACTAQSYLTPAPV